jgi:hypothetical protein
MLIKQRALRLIPARRANDLELSCFKPFGRVSPLERNEFAFAVSAPRIRARDIGVITPEKPDLLTRIDRVGDVGTDESNAL